MDLETKDNTLTNLQSLERKQAILVKIKNRYKKIEITDIDYISVDGKYSNLHVGPRIFSVRTSLKNILDQLPDRFLRVHASFIVNTSKIEAINTENNIIEFLNGIKVPYSRNYKQSLLNTYCIM